ncbi:hypothetical protein MCOR02_000438 [Pyricularia oryzae]|uniref:Uncharacterized protein n=5 Tax=Pyricularia TaxID=48558 RepID=G5EH35_PYRO7|nr:uncharacterized protein MGG_17922 [Pyricularia oryzae 70-15]ELQ40175.1 hypothetical protein OOU_Y34scaffold00458g3 [Pyricularia oryzae Y34]KAH9436771.1 hypothetical protein MCOR02_000438 [Pyricularia oryzae]KAI6297768.1 hypothetical protein MCOR33_005940 [Pyricularia grisea]EAQ71287.1 hypothetical protein MGCH7_ch7g694 [Pyricularia oryzae 70-15]EHA46043.1 hypothetical protein MGG_17922 [Pyricularia oryzae 70-15]
MVAAACGGTGSLLMVQFNNERTALRKTTTLREMRRRSPDISGSKRPFDRRPIRRSLVLTLEQKGAAAKAQPPLQHPVIGSLGKSLLPSYPPVPKVQKGLQG